MTGHALLRHDRRTHRADLVEVQRVRTAVALRTVGARARRSILMNVRYLGHLRVINAVGTWYVARRTGRARRQRVRNVIQGYRCRAETGGAGMAVCAVGTGRAVWVGG